MDVLLPHGEELLASKEIHLTFDENGRVMGKHSDNPILNTLMYYVEFPDRTIHPYTANVIANNMYAQVDSEGIRIKIFDAIIDHCTNGHAVSENDQYFITKRGRQHLRKTTSGCKLLIATKDGTKQ